MKRKEKKRKEKKRKERRKERKEKWIITTDPTFIKGIKNMNTFMLSNWAT